MTPSVVLSLGWGSLCWLRLALIDGNLRRQISGSLPEVAPNFFFVDIQASESDGFATFLQEQAPGADLMRVPMLRGRVTALNGVDAQKVTVPPEGAWVLRGDRGITYADTIPENATLAAGQWWPKDYAGEPLVSFSAEEAGPIGLKWATPLPSMCSAAPSPPGSPACAPCNGNRSASISSWCFRPIPLPARRILAGDADDEGCQAAGRARVLNAVTRAYPAVTSVRVKDALDVVNQLVAQLGTAIRAAASVALLASVLVLAGALAAGNTARIHDAVVLKTLGATRKTLIAAFSLEYMLIGLATAIFALAAGGLAAWYVVARIMKLPSAFLPEVAGGTSLLALVLTVGIGLAGTWRVLGHKAAPGAAQSLNRPASYPITEMLGVFWTLQTLTPPLRLQQVLF